MKTKLILGLLSLTAIVFSGCVGQPSIPKLTLDETMKTLNKYNKEYEEYKKIKISNKVKKEFQPLNKKENCLLVDEYDKTKKDDNLTFYWDGDCKNGYAFGLGRIFTKSNEKDIEAIVRIDNKKITSYYQKDYVQGTIEEGNGISDGYSIATFLKDDIDFNISFISGYMDDNIILATLYSPFQDNKTLVKDFGNFSYVIHDFSNNVFDNRVWSAGIYNKDKKPDGIHLTITKNKQVIGTEYSNGLAVRKVFPNYSLYEYTNSVINEVNTAYNKVMESKNIALLNKSRYIEKICAKRKKIAYMNDENFYRICEEQNYIKSLQSKVNSKLAQIEKQKEAKRAQLNQQRLIQAREAEAAAAQRRADAAEQANFNQSMQNLNNNLQMQQLNNNLMMYNLMPKTHNVYIH